MIRRAEDKVARQDAAKAKKKQKICTIIKQAKEIKDEMKNNMNFKWTREKLIRMCRYKRIPSDDPMPTKKDDLLQRYNLTRRRPSPHASPCNSDSEDEMDIDSNKELLQNQKWKEMNGSDSEEEEEEAEVSDDEF